MLSIEDPLLIQILCSLGGFVVSLLFFTWFYQHQKLKMRNQFELQALELLQTQEKLAETEHEKQHFLHKIDELNAQLSTLQQQHVMHEAQHQQFLQLQHEYKSLQQELKCLQSINSGQQAKLHQVTTLLQETQRAAQEKQQLLMESEARLSTQFENLANRIFDNSHKRVDEHNKQSLDKILLPLKEQLEGFKKQVNDSFNGEAKERHTLTQEIRQLQQLNQRMSEETLNLTQALKGNNKLQGNWGEVILSRVLENSGLREGYEYDTQVALRNEQGELYKPDVIIHLPEQRDVIVDAKMTLLAYEKYYNSETDCDRSAALNEHIHAIRQHIRGLSKKNYHQLKTLKTLNFVLMFIPIEAAFLLAIEKDPTLIEEALKQNIMLVSPSTLIVTLRTIHQIWRYEQQNKNSQAIAEQASKIYDKVRLFVDDMQLIGVSLNKAQNSYRDALKKLAEGRGNLLSQVEQFRHLGVEVKKEIADVAPLVETTFKV